MSRHVTIPDLSVRWQHVLIAMATANFTNSPYDADMARAALDNYFDALDRAEVRFHVNYR